MAEKLGRDSYVRETAGSSQTPMAQSSSSGGFQGGSIQGGGNASQIFNSYGSAQAISQQSNFDSQMVQSVVDFALKMGEPEMKRKIQEQQLFGMQMQAKGMAIEDFKKTQPGLSKFFGDTFVLEGARSFAVKNETSKKTLEIQKNWEEWKKLSPDEFRSKMNSVMMEGLTGDADTDSQIMGNMTNQLPELMVKHFKDNFKYQQDEMNKEVFNNFTLSADKLELARKDLSEGSMTPEEYNALESKFRPDMMYRPDGVSDETWQEITRSKVNYLISSGKGYLFKNVFPPEAMQQLPPQIQNIIRAGSMEADDNAASIAMRDPDYQQKYIQNESEIASLETQRNIAVSQGDIEGAKKINEDIVKRRMDFYEYATTRTGYEGAIPVSQKVKDSVEIAQSGVLSTANKAKHELEQAQKNREDIAKYVGSNSIDSFAIKLFSEGRSIPTPEEVEYIHQTYGIPRESINNEIKSSVDRLSKEHKQALDKLFDKDDYVRYANDPVNVQKYGHVLTESEYKEIVYKDYFEKQKKLKDEEVSLKQGQVDAKEQADLAYYRSLTLLSVKADDSNVNDVLFSSSAKQFSALPSSVKEDIMDKAFNELNNKISNRTAQPEDFAKLGSFITTQHLSYGDKTYSPALRDAFNTDNKYFNPKAVLQRAILFRGISAVSPQKESALRSTIGEDTYLKYKAFLGIHGDAIVKNDFSNPEMKKDWDKIFVEEKIEKTKPFEIIRQTPNKLGQYSWQTNTYIMKDKEALGDMGSSLGAVDFYSTVEREIKKEMENTGGRTNDQITQEAISRTSDYFDRTSSEKYMYQSTSKYYHRLSSSVSQSSLKIKFEPKYMDQAIMSIIKMPQQAIDSLGSSPSGYRFVEGSKSGSVKSASFVNAKGEYRYVNIDENKIDPRLKNDEIDEESVNVRPHTDSKMGKMYVITYSTRDDDGMTKPHVKFVTEQQAVNAYSVYYGNKSFWDF